MKSWLDILTVGGWNVNNDQDGIVAESDELSLETDGETVVVNERVFSIRGIFPTVEEARAFVDDNEEN